MKRYNPIQEFYEWCKQGVKNVIYWFPIIWNDRQYDFEFLFIIMRAKFDRMIDAFENNQIEYVEMDNHIDQMKRCRKILDYLIEYDADMYVSEKLEQRFGKADIYIDDSGQLHVDYPKINTEKDEEAYDEYFDDLNKEEREEYDKKVNELFQIIRENHEGWWL